jgi:hypothetical protein
MTLAHMTWAMEERVDILGQNYRKFILYVEKMRELNCLSHSDEKFRKDSIQNALVYQYSGLGKKKYKFAILI